MHVTFACEEGPRIVSTQSAQVGTSCGAGLGWSGWLSRVPVGWPAGPMCQEPVCMLAMTYLYTVCAGEIPVALDLTVLAEHAGEDARGFLRDVGIVNCACAHACSCVCVCVCKGRSQPCQPCECDQHNRRNTNQPAIRRAALT